MSEMIYAPDNAPLKENKLLARDKYKGFAYFVVNIRGKHPCGYVAIPQGHKLHGVSWERNKLGWLEVHGGVTFAEPNSRWSVGRTLEIDPVGTDWIIGWDYAHYGDYEGGRDFDRIFDVENVVKYTTEDVVLDCKSAIDQIIAKKYEEGTIIEDCKSSFELITTARDVGSGWTVLKTWLQLR